MLLGLFEGKKNDTFKNGKKIFWQCPFRSCVPESNHVKTSRMPETLNLLMCTDRYRQNNFIPCQQQEQSNMSRPVMRLVGPNPTLTFGILVSLMEF